MPRAVIIAVGDLSLHPIKSLVEEHRISCDIVTATDAETLKSIDTFGSDERNEGKQADCIFVHTQNDVFKHSKGFSDAETLLVYSTPETYLAQQLANTGSDVSTTSHIQKWKVNLNEAIQVVEQSDGVKLCSLNDILQHPKAFIELVTGKPHEGQVTAPAINLVQRGFLLSASAELVDNDELYELYDDALSIGIMFGEFTVHLSPDGETFNASRGFLLTLANRLRSRNVEVAELDNKLSSVEANYSATSTKLAESEQQKKAAEERIAELQKECNTGKEKLTGLETDVATLTDNLNAATEKAKQLEPMRESLKATEEKATNLDKQVAEYKQKLNDKNTQCENAKSELAELDKKLSSVEANYSATSTKLAESEQQKKTAEERIAELQKECNAGKEKLTGLETDVATLTDNLNAATEKAKQLEPMRESLKATEEKATNLDKQVAEYKHKLNDKNTQCENAKLELAELNKTLSSVEANYSATSTKLAESEQQKKAAEERIAELQKECNTGKEKLTGLETDVATLTDNLNAATEKARQLEPMRESLRATEEKAANLDKQVAEYKQKLNDKNAQCETAKSELAELNKKLSSVEANYSATSTKLAESEQQKKAAEERIAALQKECNTGKEKLTGLETDVATLTDNLNAATEKAKQLEPMRESLKATEEKAANLDKQVAEYKQKLNDKNAQCETAKSELAELNKKLSSVEANYSATSTKLAESEQQKKAAEERIAELQKECNTGKEKLTGLETDVATLTDNLNAATEKARQLEPMRESLRATEEKAANLDKQVAEYKQKLNDKNTQCEDAKSELAELNKKLSLEADSKDLSNLQNLQMREELDSLLDQLAQNEVILKEHEKLNINNSQLEKTLLAEKETSQLYQLQAFSLQEELESSIRSVDELKKKELEYQTYIEKLSSSNKNFETLEAENEKLKVSFSRLEQTLAAEKENGRLYQLQNSSLQEELEASIGSIDELEKKEVQSKQVPAALSSANQKVEELKAKNETLSKQLSASQVEKESITQEIEALHTKVNTMRREIEEKGFADSKDSEVIEQLGTELELATLQITQLQEEIEHYYAAAQKYESAVNSGNIQGVMGDNKIQHKAFDKVSAERISVTGQYIEDGYRDIHLNLHNVTFPTGKALDNLEVKLLNMSGSPGIEFRRQEDQSLFREYEDATDEYGPYLRYILTLPENLQHSQQKMLERLNASERLLLVSSINLVSRLLQNNDILTNVAVSPADWREWRKAAVLLAEHTESFPNWLSFDEVHLREEFRADGYEHLWLVFNNVLHGSVWRNTLEFKLSASAIGASDNSEFSDNLSIEFRELSDGAAPLVTWPPEDADDFGPKLNIVIDDLSVLNDLATQDGQLIHHLIANLPSIIEKLETKQSALKRSKDEWISAVEALLQGSLAVPAQEGIAGVEEPAVTDERIQLSCEEIVSEGSYQHIVFTQSANDIKIKLRAENINPETFDAEVYLELRDGTNQVIYNNSNYYGEDEYGPRVMLPADMLLELQESGKLGDFEWAINVFQEAQATIEHSETIDELIRLLWKNMLSRKSNK